MSDLVTLTTDFGTRDPYVAAMKGVILSIARDVRIVDLGHEFRAGHVMEGALFLAASIPYFPAGTVHVAVIDPGVGTARRALAVRVLEQIVVAPDNGLITVLERRFEIETARMIENRSLMREQISNTFHGRDVFAPVAAHLALGTPFDSVGPEADTWVRLPSPEPSRDEHGRWRGAVVHVDRFGNAITSIPESEVDGPVAVAQGHRFPIRRTYGEVAPGEALGMIGSTGYLELSVNGASAAEQCGIAEGDDVRVERDLNDER